VRNCPHHTILTATRVCLDCGQFVPADGGPPAQASACPVCGGRINSLTGHCHATHVIEGTRLSDGTFAPNVGVDNGQKYFIDSDGKMKPDSFDSDAGRTYDFEPAPTTAYKHVPLTTGASLEPERPNFSGWTEEKPSESATSNGSENAAKNPRKSAAADEAREAYVMKYCAEHYEATGDELDFILKCDYGTAVYNAAACAWDAALEWARKNGGGR